MKRFPFLLLILVTFLVELFLCFSIIRGIRDEGQDSVVVNECRKSVEENFGDSSKYKTLLPYSVIDTTDVVLFKTTGTDTDSHLAIGEEDLSDSVNEAVKNNDTILDLTVNGETVGKILIYNQTLKRTEKAKKDLMRVLVVFSALQLILIFSYYLYLQNTILKPFKELNDFAVRIAGGNLDIPLDVDKKHVFGSFTEAFDLMRSELKKAQIAEKKANDEKKETIAKLSHDIKTPVASIKSSSEIGYELAGDEKSKEYFHLINEKADQITTLTDNLFNSSIHEITEISVNPVKQPSAVVEGLLKNADYQGKVIIRGSMADKAGAGEADGNLAGENRPDAEQLYQVPKCDVMIDKLRLQQVFDNLFMNSYKYAGTEITLQTALSEEYLMIGISDSGPGVRQEELPLLKEKYKRGGNASEKDGAGLGLYLSDYFLKEMGGKLEISSDGGFTARVFLRRIS